MLPEKHRLKLSRRKGADWKEKKELYTPLFKLVYRFSRKVDPPRIGFIVTGKLGISAKRNRIRRVLSEVVRRRLEEIPSGVEILIIASKGISEAKYEEINACFDKILPKLHRRF